MQTACPNPHLLGSQEQWCGAVFFHPKIDVGTVVKQDLEKIGGWGGVRKTEAEEAPYS